MSEPTIVITAASAITSLGTSRHATLDAMLVPHSGPWTGVREAPSLEARPNPDANPDSGPDSGPDLSAGEAVESRPSVGCVSDRAERLLARAVRAAIAEARLDAALSSTAGDGRAAPRILTLLGTTLGGMRHWGAALRGGGADEVRRLTAASVLADALAETGLPMGGVTLCAACASGLTSVAAAAALLRVGEAEVVLAGGYDPISEFALGGFLALKLVAPTALRPFAIDREGMKLAEGYGVLVMERLDDALARGVVPLAIVAGTGEASDGHHLTQPHPEGAGAARAVRAALADAGQSHGTVDLLAAHATATPANDEAEYRAYAAVFGERLAAIPVMALKARLGHALGAAGAIELALGIAAMERGIIPATATGSVDRERFPWLDLVAEPREAGLRRTLHVSLGFGGADACAIVGRFDGAAVSLHRSGDRLSETRRVDSADVTGEDGSRVEVTGVGVLLPGAHDLASLGALMQRSTTERSAGQRSGSPRRTTGVASDAAVGAGRVDQAVVNELVDPRAARRIAQLSQLTRAVGVLAVRDAGLTPEDLAETHAIVATEHGAVGYTQAYYEELVRSGVDMGNPMLFAESVPNVASAQLSLGLALGGATFTVIGSRLAGLQALHLAAARLRDGRWQRAIVVAVEERDPLLDEWMTRFGLMSRAGTADGAGLGAGDGDGFGSGAVALVLERDTERRRRGRRAVATIGRTALAWPVTRRLRDRLRTAARLALDTLPGVTLVTPGADHWLGRLERRVARRHNRGPADLVPTAELHSITALLPLFAALARGESAAVLAMDAYGGAAVTEVVVA